MSLTPPAANYHTPFDAHEPASARNGTVPVLNPVNFVVLHGTRYQTHVLKSLTPQEVAGQYFGPPDKPFPSCLVYNLVLVGDANVPPLYDMIPNAVKEKTEHERAESAEEEGGE